MRFFHASFSPMPDRRKYATPMNTAMYAAATIHCPSIMVPWLAVERNQNIWSMYAGPSSTATTATERRNAFLYNRIKKF